MRNSVARIDLHFTSSRKLPPMQNGIVNPAFFKLLQATYQEKTGYNLVLSDPNGSIQMGFPDCDKFPCMKSCRQCREHIVAEALRTGKVCIDACHEGYTIWGLPFANNGKIMGGLIVIGGEHRSSHDDHRFKSACVELYKLMDSHDLLPETHKFNEIDLNDIHRFVYRKSYDDLNESVNLLQKSFLSHLQTADFEEAKADFMEIKKAFESIDDLPMDIVLGLVGEMIYDARKQFIQAGMDSYACTAEAGALIDRVSSVNDMDGVGRILDTFLERFFLLSAKRPKDQDDMVIERATTFLEENLRDNLTREQVAKAVGISPSHFSRLIREKKGRTFTDLLNQYRIEHASTMLVRSSFTLARIADETGFCDQSYFSKVFRRYKDMSPAQYRDLHRE